MHVELGSTSIIDLFVNVMGVFNRKMPSHQSFRLIEHENKTEKVDSP